MRWTLFFSLLSFSASLHAALKVGDIVTSSDSKPILMDFEDAEEFCHDMAMNLPTAREFAQFAKRHGATGLRESKFRNQSTQSPLVRSETSRNASEGFLRIDKNTGSGAIVPDFYYSSRGYHRPHSTPKTASWSLSSIRPARQNQVLRYVFDETQGQLIAVPENSKLAVRCIQ